jgi:hypothetical protein
VRKRAQVEDQIRILHRGANGIQNASYGVADVAEVGEIFTLNADTETAVVLIDDRTACLQVFIPPEQADHWNGRDLACPQ